MRTPLQITFRGLDRSDAIEAAIEKHAARLERFHHRITGCHVTVELPHQHHHKGNIFRVRVDLTVPGEEVVVGHDPGVDHSHEDVYVAIRDAFNATARRLEDVLRKPRAEFVHPHEHPLFGHVRRIVRDEHYGFIDMDDGLSVYFHENSVLEHKFDALSEGDKVRVVVADTESPKGPQASTVERV